MKKMITVCTLLAVTLLAPQGYAANYTVDKTHSNVMFTVKHLFSDVSGQFTEFGGTFTFDEKKPETSEGKFTAKTESISTLNAKRDDHLRGEDFFDAKNHPELALVLKKLKKAGKNKFKAETDMTLRGVTKPVTFDLEYQGQMPFMDKVKAGFKATAKIKRKDFGISWNKTLDKGSLLVGEDVAITIQIEADETK